MNNTMHTALLLAGHPAETMAGRKRLSYRSHIDGKRSFFIVKRTMDILLSVVMVLLVFSWLFPLIALLIKLDSRGPLFFLQKRVGRGGRSFTCYKFRTMIVNEEAHYRQATENDVRITRLGKFLRNTNIDELPQFFNVLLGNMSIVGPRPHMHADCRQFAGLIPHYKLRNLVKPGITGMAQVKGYHGPAQDEGSIGKRYQWDIFYIRHAGPWLDIRIMIRTLAQHLRLLMHY
jgi:putative colanic acid biosynthesis UDP-glucose lipid carrier transferase